MDNPKNKPIIILKVDQEFKDRYIEYWKAKDYQYEAECTRALIRKALRDFDAEKEAKG